MESRVDAPGREDGNALGKSVAIRRGDYAQRFEVRVVALAPGTNNGGPRGKRERRGRTADGTRSTFDEECLAVEVAQALKNGRRSRGSEPCGGGLRRRPSLGHHTPGGQDRELGGGVADPAQTEDEIAHLYSGHIRSDLVDYARGIPARDGWQLERQKLRKVASAQKNVDGVHARGMHLNPDRPLGGVGLGRILNHENIGGSVGVETSSAHEVLYFLMRMTQQTLAAERNTIPTTSPVAERRTTTDRVSPTQEGREPTNHELYGQLDQIFAARDRANMAPTIAALLPLLEEHPSDARVLYEVGGAYDTDGQESVALGFYEQAMDAGLSGDLRRRCFLQYGSTLRNLGRIDESLAVFARARAEFPDSVALGAFEALSLHAAGRANTALARLLELLADNVDAEELNRYKAAMKGNAAYLESLDS